MEQLGKMNDLHDIIKIERLLSQFIADSGDLYIAGVEIVKPSMQVKVPSIEILSIRNAIPTEVSRHGRHIFIKLAKSVINYIYFDIGNEDSIKIVKNLPINRKQFLDLNIAMLLGLIKDGKPYAAICFCIKSGSFGYISGGLGGFLSEYGMDPIDNDSTILAQSVYERIHTVGTESVTIKELLLNQRVVPGLGEYIVSRTLKAIEMSPDKKCLELSLEEFFSIFQRIKTIVENLLNV